MHVRLIHNAGSGGSEEGSTDELIHLIERAGHTVRYSEYAPGKIDAWVDDRSDFVVVAGGDGTIGNVATSMSGKRAPLLVVPMGTANNIGGSLGLATGPEALERTLKAPSKRPLDLGVARGSWGERTFVEGAGIGLFQHTLEHEASDEDKEPDHAVRLLRDVLGRFEPRALELEIDGRKITGRYLLVEAMNIPCLGPNLRLAPSADPGDGVLDVVLAAEDDRAELARYLDRKLEGDTAASANLRVDRAREVRIRADGCAVRLDDGVPPEGDVPRPEYVEIGLRVGAITLLVPAG